jgi:PadR family transcriptional regulator
LKTKAELLPGTLDLLILKAVSMGPQHGYGVLLRIEQITGGALTIEQGALYPALYRLERQSGLASEWGTSDSNRWASCETAKETVFGNSKGSRLLPAGYR